MPEMPKQGVCKNKKFRAYNIALNPPRQSIGRNTCTKNFSILSNTNSPAWTSQFDLERVRRLNLRSQGTAVPARTLTVLLVTPDSGCFKVLVEKKN
jgi:hypothetical protein